jgi:hypothetical protein
MIFQDFTDKYLNSYNDLIEMGTNANDFAEGVFTHIGPNSGIAVWTSLDSFDGFAIFSEKLRVDIEYQDVMKMMFPIHFFVNGQLVDVTVYIAHIKVLKSKLGSAL